MQPQNFMDSYCDRLKAKIGRSQGKFTFFCGIKVALVRIKAILCNQIARISAMLVRKWE